MVTNSLHSASSKVKCVTNKLLLRKTKIDPQNNVHFKLSGRTERENGWFELMTFSSFSSLGLCMALVAPIDMALIRGFLPHILQHKVCGGQCRSCKRFHLFEIISIKTEAK